MTRLHLEFGCGSLKLTGTLDTAPGTTGLLIVSGGNEIRAGAFSGQAKLAAEIADAGFPVFRFDRRGIGDSEGENRGFRHSKRDIAAAVHAFEAMAPQVERIVAFGNCDAASALMLASGSDCDRLILSNPWTVDSDSDTHSAVESMPASAIRERYLSKLANPREIWRLLSGKVDLRNLARGLLRTADSSEPASELATEMRAGLKQFGGDVRFLIAEDDRTAQIFLSMWDQGDDRIRRCSGAGHSYVEPHAQAWLREQILDVLRA